MSNYWQPGKKLFMARRQDVTSRQGIPEYSCEEILKKIHELEIINRNLEEKLLRSEQQRESIERTMRDQNENLEILKRRLTVLTDGILHVRATKRKSEESNDDKETKKSRSNPVKYLAEAVKIWEETCALSEERVSLDEIMFNDPAPNYLPLFPVGISSNKIGKKKNESPNPSEKSTKESNLAEDEELVDGGLEETEAFRIWRKEDDDQRLYLLYRNDDGLLVRKICEKLQGHFPQSIPQQLRNELPMLDLEMFLRILPNRMQVLFKTSENFKIKQQLQYIQIDLKQNISFISEDIVDPDHLRTIEYTPPYTITPSWGAITKVQTSSSVKLTIQDNTGKSSFSFNCYVLPAFVKKQGRTKKLGLILGQDFLYKFLKSLQLNNKLFFMDDKNNIYSTTYFDVRTW